MIANRKDVIRDILKDGVASGSIGAGGIGQAIAIMKIAFAVLVMDRQSLQLHMRVGLPVSISNRSTLSSVALAFMCLVNDTKSPQSAP